MNFTYAHYADTLRRYLAAKYRIFSFRDFLSTASEPAKYVILRHDIDLDLVAALNIARIEKSVGVTATYFVRLHAKGYNPMTLEGMRILKEIRELGHEIALHFEPGMAAVLGEDEIRFADRQKAIFEGITGEALVGFSTHEPARADNDRLVTDLVARWNLHYHAYEKRFTQDIKYLSDSGARWREGCFSEWVDKKDRFQVLTHPFWWFENVPQERY
jgi:hypothetical protein